MFYGFQTKDASCRVLGFYSETRASQIFKRQDFPPALGRRNQLGVMVRRDAPAVLPRRDGRIWLAQVCGQIGHRRPDAEYVFHADTLRILRIAVNPHFDKCVPHPAYLKSASK